MHLDRDEVRKKIVADLVAIDAHRLFAPFVWIWMQPLIWISLSPLINVIVLGYMPLSASDLSVSWDLVESCYRLVEYYASSSEVWIMLHLALDEVREEGTAGGLAVGAHRLIPLFSFAYFKWTSIWIFLHLFIRAVVLGLSVTSRCCVDVFGAQYYTFLSGLNNDAFGMRRRGRMNTKSIGSRKAA